MSWWQHFKGVFYAIITAVVILFLISFFVGSEVRVSKSYVLNVPADSVYQFLKSPKNFNKWVDGASDFEISYPPKGLSLKYEGYKGGLHEFKYQCFDKSNGVELSYIRGGEKQAVYTLKCASENDGTILSYEKVWKLSPNPLLKIISIGLDEDIEVGMDKEVKNLKRYLQH